MMKILTCVVCISVVSLLTACKNDDTVSTPIKTVTQRAPSTPVRVRVTALSSSKISVSWADTSLFATGFRLQRRQQNGIWEFDTLLGTTRTFLDTNLQCNTRYFYHVAAFNAFGTSTFSNSPSAQTLKDDFASLTSGTGNHLYGVCFTTADTGYAVGDKGIILRTMNGGMTWDTLTSGVANTLRGIYFSKLMSGIVVGSGGTILRTTDGGMNWNKQTKMTQSNLQAISLIGSNNWIAVGTSGAILRSSNDGVDWTVQTIEPKVSLFAVTFPDENVGVIVGANGTVLRTIDGGVSFVKQASQTLNNLYDVSFADAATGIAVGYAGTIIQTTDGGMTWNIQASGTSNSLNAISFRNPNEAVVVGSKAVFVDTENGGQTWKVQPTSITASNMHGIAFKNLLDGITVGDYGTIVMVSTCTGDSTGQSSHTIMRK